VRIVGTEQNPAGLGPNVDDVRRRCDITMAKMHFDACADGLLALLAEGRPAGEPAGVVVAGCEAHVCLLQTALGLLDAGHRVRVVENACGARRPSDHEAAMRRLQGAGAIRVSAEMVVFEWLRSCEHPAFREVLGLVKAHGTGS
jgi:nicotinamidase-related amidase